MQADHRILSRVKQKCYVLLQCKTDDSFLIQQIIKFIELS